MDGRVFRNGDIHSFDYRAGRRPVVNIKDYLNDELEDKNLSVIRSQCERVAHNGIAGRTRIDIETDFKLMKTKTALFFVVIIPELLGMMFSWSTRLPISVAEWEKVIGYENR